MTLRKKMIVLIVLPTLFIFVAVLGLTMLHLQKSAQAEIEQHTSRLAANYAARFDGAFRVAAAIADATAHFIETVPDLTESQIFSQLRANVTQNPYVYGAAMAFEPGQFKTDDSLFSPYVYRGADGLAQMNITRDVYDWYTDEHWQWWHSPKRTRKGEWTDPYFDEGAGNVLMTTYSAPFFAGDEFRGVTTVDIMLPTLQENIGSKILGHPDYVILNSRGQYVYSPNPDLIMSRTVFEVAQANDRTDLADVARSILSGNAGVTTVEAWDTPGLQYIFYAPIASTGWSFAIRLSHSEIMAGVNSRMAFAALALASTLLMILGCIWFVSGRITHPIEQLRSKALQIASGDLDARIDNIASKDEIGELARSFNTMTAELRSHVERLASERATREKMEHDLDIARSIQQGLLPDEPPKVDGFDIAGWSLPADQTGGDYFDWQQMPDGRTVLSLADVSGHGIGPALVTAVCRAYSRAIFPFGSDLCALMDRINDLLLEDLPPERFVTFVVALVEPNSSHVPVLSAGHGPLFVFRSVEGRVENYKANGIPLGVAKGFEYESPLELELATGDMLVLITDGFFEWPNSAGEQFGTQRIDAAICDSAHLPAIEIVAYLRSAVLDFVGGTPQGDDLTAVVVKRVGDS